MKTLKILAACSIFIGLGVEAGDVSCTGKVSVIMAEHNSCRDESGKKQFAYKLEGFSTWKCSSSDSASSLLLAAKISNKSITVYQSDKDGATCANHSDYLKASYIIM